MARRCQPCTACCDGWVRIRVNGHEASPGHPCPHSTGRGCDDYENRPVDPCVNFRCGWIREESPLPDWMKPNEAKVIVIFNKLQWQGLAVDLAVPVGRRVPPRALNWLKAFAERQGRPLVYSEQVKGPEGFTGEQTVFGFGPPQFQDWVVQSQKAGRRLW
ncbi:MAG: hypothetical protein U9Q81_22655 [Pseudomonadota bacterium]|nr:hypothetical protein [Pseudomonadota bacterium]